MNPTTLSSSTPGQIFSIVGPELMVAAFSVDVEDERCRRNRETDRCALDLLTQIKLYLQTTSPGDRSLVRCFEHLFAGRLISFPSTTANGKTRPDSHCVGHAISIGSADPPCSLRIMVSPSCRKKRLASVLLRFCDMRAEARAEVRALSSEPPFSPLTIRRFCSRAGLWRERVFGGTLKGARLQARRLQLRSLLAGASVCCESPERWMPDKCWMQGRRKLVACFAITRYDTSSASIISGELE